VAGGQERVLRRRIKSVTSTRKITKAMELIAAAQIPRSLARIVANRPYRDGMRRIIVEAVQGDPASARRLLETPEHVECATVLLVAGDRGLSGPYNNQTLRAGERVIADLRAQGTRVRLVTVGKKAAPYFRFRGVEVEDSFSGFVERPTFSDAQTIARFLAAPFIDGEVQQILLVSTRYLSAATQAVEVRQLLPFQVDEAPETSPERLEGYTEFEPEVSTLLVNLAPRALESEVFSALLEGAAAFLTSQQRAMAAATDNADELARTLSRVMNRARQDAITTEIMEIVGGAEALRSGK
jgi:F-type H+-transporting ATPase subunit gamma